jgi:hypothetical protein
LWRLLETKRTIDTCQARPSIRIADRRKLAFPELAISPKDGSIFMIESTAGDILRIAVNKDGTAGAPQTYVQVQGNILDGLAFSRSRNLYVSCYYPNRIYVISPDRNIELLIEDTTGEILNHQTNVAFEPKGTRLFFANLGGQHIGVFDVGERGAPTHYPKLRAGQPRFSAQKRPRTQVRNQSRPKPPRKQ